MQSYQPFAASSLQDAVEQVKADLQALRNEIQSHSEWYSRFEHSLEKQQDQIAKLVQGLDREIETRKLGQDSMSQALSNSTQQLASMAQELKRRAGVFTSTETNECDH